MISIQDLTEDDIGKWVVYREHSKLGEKEFGRIKSWNDQFIFVVYKCDGQWSRFQDFTGAATSPEDLSICTRVL